MVIISPFEARELRRRILEHERVTLHTYAARPTLEYDPLDGIDLFTDGAAFDTKLVLRNLTAELNISAGQLYFNSHKEYIDVCKYLGLAWNSKRDGIEVQSDGFIVAGGNSAFRQSPVKFLNQSIDKTHMGNVLEGGLLERCDFDTLLLDD